MTNKPYQDPDTLYELYYEQGLSQQEIADRFGVGDSTISNWIRKHDIPKYPWEKEQVLRELYWDEEMSIADVADELDTDVTCIHRWMVEHEIPRRKGRDDPRPWRDEETLRELYFDEEMSQRDIAEHFDTTQGVINDWFRRFDIDVPSYAEAGQIARRVDRAYFYTSTSGYELAGSRVGESTYDIQIHRLVAIAEEGYNSVAGNVVHHENEIPWDNRPSNLTVMDELEHRNMHVRGENNPFEAESIE